jgi:hypothetical protein
MGADLQIEDGGFTLRADHLQNRTDVTNAPTLVNDQDTEFA